MSRPPPVPCCGFVQVLRLWLGVTATAVVGMWALGKELRTVEVDLSDKITASEQRMGAKVDAMGDKVTASEQRMGAKITASEERMGAKVDASEQRLRGDIDGFKNQLTDTLRELLKQR